LVGTLTNEAVSRFDEVELPDFLIERIESENIVSGRVSRCNDTFGIYYLSYGTGFTSYLEIYTLSGKLLTRDYSGDAGAGTFRIFDWPSVITDDCEIVWQRSF
jgi:hypothetical protein